MAGSVIQTCFFPFTVSVICTSRILGRNSRRMKNYNRPFILMISILLIVIGIMTAWYMITHAIPNQPFEAASRLPR